jgi:hypothetical protein
LIPMGTLNAELLASAIASSRGVTRNGENTPAFELDFGIEKWRSTAPAGAASGNVWTDPKTGLQIATPQARDSVGVAVIRAVSGDGRTYAVEEFEQDETGTPRWTFDARDAYSGRAVTLDAGRLRNPGAGLVAAAFSTDGRWLYSLDSGGMLSIQWVVGSGLSSDWIADMAGALTGYRLVGETILEPLNSEALANARDRAMASARAAADRGDLAARLALTTLERGKAQNNHGRKD